MTSVSLRPREDVVAHDDLPTIGRLSFWISQRTVTSRLRPGSWLDLLSGSKATLQRSQLNNAAISAFHALDHQLEPELIGLGIELHEQQVDTTLPFADATFDNVTINNGLEHLWNPQEILQECHRVLRPGGALQVVVPTWFGKPFLEFLAFRLRNRQAFIEMNDHKMYYDERTLWPMLVRAGFFPQWISLRRIKLNCSLHAVAVKAEPSSPDAGDRR